jgi:hypothetical protein
VKTLVTAGGRKLSHVGPAFVAFIGLSFAGCFTTPDPSRLQCKTQAGCPEGYYCAADFKCHPGGEAEGAGGVAGGAGGASLDGSPGAGGAGDGASPLDGAGDSSVDVNGLPSGGGGAGGSPDGPGLGGTAAGGALGGTGGILTGSGGISPPDAPSGTGGMMPPDAPPATGGTTSPDAPDANDGPAPLDNGSTCTSGTQCASTFCVDGVCCDDKCDGQCQSCKETGSLGTCKVIKGAPIATRAACAGAGVCIGQCDGSHRDCTFDSTTVCAAQSCSGGVRTNKSICDGKGTCPAQTTTNCADNQCTADGTDCSTCTDEPAATTCAGGHCGPISNNCGHTVQCSTTCSGTGQTCGGGGFPGLCGCTPQSTSQTCGSHCGTLDNNCGQSVDCGGCTAPQTCGGGGTANVCGCTPSCTGKCGGSDACGGTCPDNCVAPQTCGGGGTANVCGCTPNCTGKCGGSNACGGTCPNNCVAPQTCGGGGTVNVCGCTPNSSACAGRTCGSVSNGCGGTVSCGTCATGMVCNASGTCQCANNAQPACGACLGWDFEGWSSPAPWVREFDPNWPGGNGATNMQLSQAQHRGGSYSLAAPILIDMTNTYTAGVAASTSCSVNLAGYKLSAWIYFDSTMSLSDHYNVVQVDNWNTSGGQGDHIPLKWGNIPLKSWFEITYTFVSAVPVNRIGIRLSPAGNWQGTMYIDDVVITGL